MKIIVTGCAGMIGCHLMSKLITIFPNKNGNQIIGIDDLSRGTIDNLKEACKQKDDEFEFIEADLSIYDDSWAKSFENADIIIHLADIVAGIGFVFNNESYIFRTNLLINSNVGKAISLQKPKRYIYVGTACSFPKNLQLSVNSPPLREEDQLPALPESGYGWSKLMGEIEANLLAKEGVTNSVILSLHNVYGRYCDYSSKSSQVIPSLCVKAIKASQTGEKLEIWGDGSQGRAFVNADDVVNAIISSFYKGENSGVIQIGPNTCTSINELSKLIVEQIDNEIDIFYDLSKPVGDIGRCADFSKAKRILGWEPKVNLKDGLSSLIEWMREKDL